MTGNARLLTVAALLLAVTAPLASARAQGHPPPLVVTSCKISAGEGTRDTMSIAFRNISPTALTKIIWRGAYGSGWIDFVDEGSFNPGDEIDHKLANPIRMKPRVWSFYNREGLGGCRPIETQDANGNLWRDESLSHDDPRHLPPGPSDDNPPMPRTYPNDDQNPVGVIGCTVRYHRDRYEAFGLVNVRFKNLSPNALKEITFLVYYPGGGYYMSVEGSYASQAFINVAFDNVSQAKNHAKYQKIETDRHTIDYHSVDEPQNCVATKVLFADGTTWTHPDGIPSPPLFLVSGQ